MASVYYVGEDGHVLPFVRGFSAPTAREAWNTNLYVTNSGDGTIARIDQQGAVTTFLSGLSVPNGPYGVSIDGITLICDRVKISSRSASCWARNWAGWSKG